MHFHSVLQSTKYFSSAFKIFDTKTRYSDNCILQNKNLLLSNLNVSDYLPTLGSLIFPETMIGSCDYPEKKQSCCPACFIATTKSAKCTSENRETKVLKVGRGRQGVEGGESFNKTMESQARFRLTQS